MKDLVLGIESTCDETACAIVKEGREILSNVVSSQIDLQSQFGGVVPELACRRHIDVILPVVQEALEKASVSLQEIDLIAVAKGPGLIGAIMIGLNAAKALSWSLDIPFVGVNHVEAHLYASIMSCSLQPTFPALGMVLSGGHTSLVLIEGIGSYQLIGQTIDDALGEAFDKTAKVLSLPYPGGPEIEKLARQGNSDAFSLKAGTVKGKPFSFSFSGLKTGVLYAAKGQGAQMTDPVILSGQQQADLAASFQMTAFNDVVKKVVKASKEYSCRTVVFGGGVCCNQTLRQLFAKTDLQCLWPPLDLALDNAAMIAGLGYHQYHIQKKGDALDLEPSTRIPL